MAWSSSEKEMKQMARQQEESERRSRAEIKRQVGIAYKTGRTVPYDLRTLIEAGVSVKRIYKVIRR